MIPGTTRRFFNSWKNNALIIYKSPSRVHRRVESSENSPLPTELARQISTRRLGFTWYSHQASDFYRPKTSTWQKATAQHLPCNPDVDTARISTTTLYRKLHHRGARLPIFQRRRAGFPRGTMGETLFHWRWWERRRWRQLSVTRDRRETAKWVPQPPFLRVFRLTIWIMANWRDLKRLWEKAVADGAYKEKMHLIIIIWTRKFI